MNKFIVLTFAFCLFLCKGLELTFDRKLVGSRSSRTACGILRCVEHNQTSNKIAISNDHDATSASDQIAHMSSLEIFKLKPYTKELKLLASISPKQSRLSRVSNGIEVEGHLTKGMASLQLKLNKDADCDTGFVCRAIGVGINGKELIKTSQISHISGEERNPAKDPDVNSKLIMQVLDLVQEMNAKLAVMGKVVGNLEDELNGLRETTGQGMKSLKHSLEEKINNLEDKKGAENGRLEDKIHGVNQNLEAKTDRLEDKIESAKDRLEDIIKSQTVNVRPRDEVSEELGKLLKMGISNLGDEMSKIQENLDEFEAAINISVWNTIMKLSIAKQAEDEQYQFIAQNTTKLENFCDKIDSLSHVVNDGFSSLSISFHDKFFNLSSDVTTSTTNILKVITEQQTFNNNHFSGEDFLYTLANPLFPKNCYKGMSIYVPASLNKYFTINPSQNNDLIVPVLCDMRTDGGGWVVIQRRILGDVDFYRGWLDYKRGFGALFGDFWLGNEIIHNLTSNGEFELRIDLSYNGGSAFAQYGSFSIGDEARNYALSVSKFSGTAGDSLSSVHNGAAFSTKDRDNDKWGNNCAISYTGAWWYNACHLSNLNGEWAATANKGLRWSTYSSTNSVTFSEMKIRRLVGKTI